MEAASRRDHAPATNESANRFNLKESRSRPSCADGGAKVAIESAKPSLLPGPAAPGVRARVAPGRNLSQPVEVMGPAFGMAGALRGIGQARVGQAQQRSVRLLDQIDLDRA